VVSIAVNTEWVWVFSYVTFLFLAGYIVSLPYSNLLLGSGIGNTTVVAPSVPPPNADPLTTLIYVIQNIGFLFYIAFLSPFSGYGILGFITIAGGITTLYIIFRLIRGGG